jgi:hypothetical protein
MPSTHLLHQGWYRDVAARLDAVTELVRMIAPSKPPEWQPDISVAAELVRATGMAAGPLAQLHTQLGQLHAASLDNAAVTAWREAVQHLQAVHTALQDVPAAIRQHRHPPTPTGGMFESRYGGNIAHAQHELLTAARTYATEVANTADGVLDTRLTLSTAMAKLGRLRHELVDLIRDYPLAIAVTTHGERDPLGADLARLVADLQYVLIRYQTLETVPAAVLEDATHDFTQLRHSARHIAQPPASTDREG